MAMLMLMLLRCLVRLRHILRSPLVDTQPWYPFSADVTVTVNSWLPRARTALFGFDLGCFSESRSMATPLFSREMGNRHMPELE